MSILAYTYNADTHCVSCAAARWPRCVDGWLACTDDHGDPTGPVADSEGNPIGAIFRWDENPDGITCGTCGSVVLEPAEPEGECECDNCLAAESADV